MVTAHLEMLIQDEAVSQVKGMGALTEGFEPVREDFFLDGPVSRRLAVVDFDPATGQLAKPARWIPPKPGGSKGRYDVAKDAPLDSPPFIQLHTFATVLRTMYLYEEADALGRRLRWGFDGPQLLVIPRAGKWANAFYERDSRSLQFFYFEADGRTIYTALTRDIVSHETGHAILDGIAPDLYGAVTPQALALHEAVADLTALMMAFRSERLRTEVLSATRGSIENSNAFNALAEQFGQSLDPSKRAGYLRTTLNDLGLSSREIDPLEPHDLSQVFSGAMYTLMMGLHADQKRRLGFAHDAEGWLQIAGKALGLAAQRFKRMLIRGLDYLPPGEVSFADCVRAILAADQASFPEDPDHVREELRYEFARRDVVADAAELEVKTNYHAPALDDVDLESLLKSDWAAYHFANKHRDLLRMPQEIPFEVRPRLRVNKRNYYAGGERKTQQELLFKVMWHHVEPNPPEMVGAPRRAVDVGTTLAIDWETRDVRACLTSDLRDEMRASRDGYLLRLADRGLLKIGSDAFDPHGRPLRTIVPASVVDGTLTVEETGRTLHVTGDE